MKNPDHQNAREHYPEIALLTVGEATQLLAFKSRGAIDALRRAGKLTPVPGFGRAVRFRYSDIMRLIDGESAG